MHLKRQKGPSSSKFLHRPHPPTAPSHCPGLLSACLVPGLHGASRHWSKSAPTSCDNVSPGEHHSASQDAAALLGPLCPPIPLCSHHGCDFHLPQASDGTDPSRTQSCNFLRLCFSLSRPSLFLALLPEGSLSFSPPLNTDNALGICLSPRPPEAAA